MSELEFEVFRANDLLRRICLQCGDVTTWRLAEQAPARKPPQPSRGARGESERQPTEPRPRSDRPVAAEADTMHGPYPQRRMYPRVKVNLKACISQPGSEDDIATVINMSRGGILVSSDRVYQAESWIQLSVPYTPAAANIFIPARIVRRADTEGTYQYGIKYVRG